MGSSTVHVVLTQWCYAVFKKKRKEKKWSKDSEEGEGCGLAMSGYR